MSKTRNGIGFGYRTGMASKGSLLKQLLPLANSDIVQWNAIDAVDETGTNVFTITLNPGVSYLSTYKALRVSGCHKISKLNFYVANSAGITRFDFIIWRFDGSTYDEIYRENITAKLSDGTITIDLATDVDVIEGDLIGYFGISTNNTTKRGALNNATSGMRYLLATNYSGDNVNWTGTTINYEHILILKGTSPLIVGIGDSIMESYPLHTSMVDVTRTTVNISKSWLYKLHALDNRFIYQNCGIGAEATTAIAARFARDVTAKKPRFAVINGGVNDIAGAVAKATFIAKWTSMLDACNMAGIIPIVWKIMPWSNGTNTQMQTRDEWNDDLVTLFNSYTNHNKWILIDWDADLGQNRVGGDVSNLWDIKTAYNQDGVHFNEYGQAKIAEVVLREIGKKYIL